MSFENLYPPPKKISGYAPDGLWGPLPAGGVWEQVLNFQAKMQVFMHYYCEKLPLARNRNHGA